MTQIQLSIPIKLKVENTDEMKEDILKYLKNHSKLKPVRIGYTIEYAESLEYGTGPLNTIQSTVHGGSYSYRTIYNEILKWAGRKDGKGSGLPIEDEEERRNFAKHVTDNFFQYGMKPHPYWRPAIQWLQDNMQKRFDEGYSLYEIADETLRIANKCIMDQNLPFSGNLQKSALIEEISPEDGKHKDLKDYSSEERNRIFEASGFTESMTKGKK